MPIHPSFRMIALAEPPVVGSSNQQWLNSEMLTMFMYHHMRELSQSEELHILNQLVSKVWPIASHIVQSIILYIMSTHALTLACIWAVPSRFHTCLIWSLWWIWCIIYVIIRIQMWVLRLCTCKSPASEASCDSWPNISNQNSLWQLSIYTTLTVVHRWQLILSPIAFHVML